MVNITYDTSRCIKCGLCVKTCAMGHLRMTEDGPAPGRGTCMGCLQCAAICPQKAVLNNGQSAAASRPADPVEALIRSRRSIRHFKPEAPDRSILQHALDGAGYAPSGKNRRDNRWTVVYGRKKVKAVADRAIRHCLETGEAPELARFAEKGLDLLTCGAPVLILAWSPDDCLNPVIDPAIALATAELLLVNQGLGTCWGGYLRQITGHCPALRKMLGIPDGCSLRGCLMVGIPDGPKFSNIPARPSADILWLEEEPV